MKKITLFFLLSVQIAFATPDYLKLSSTLADQHIIPLYKDFAQKTNDLAQEVNQLCQNPNVNQLSIVQESFKQMALSWGRVQHINFGPIQYLDGYAKMEFFPDKKGFTQRKLRKVLDEENPAILKEVQEGKETPPLQSFGAMEHILFSPVSHLQNSEYRCQLLQSQSQFFQSHAGKTQEAWQTFYKDAFNSVAENNQDAAKVSIAEMMKSNLFALDHAVSRQIGLSYAPKKKKGKPFYVQFPLSKISFEVLEQNIKTQQEIVKKIYASIIVKKLGKEHLGKLLTHFDHVLNKIQTFDMPLREAVSQSQTRKQVQELYLHATVLYRIFARTLTESLDIPIGFNALDGD